MARAEGDVVITVGGNVSPLTDAVTKAERTLGKLSTATQRADKQFRAMVGTSTEMQARIDALSGVTDRLGKSATKSAAAFEEFDKSKAAIDRLRASYDPLFAASKRYEAAVETLEISLRQGVITQQQYAAMSQKLAKSMLAGEGGMKGLGKQGADTANVFAQLNDVGMMAFSGQSPFMLAIQQGSQLNQVWAGMAAQGKGTRDIFATIGQAAMGMVSPMSLATLGVIAGGAALLQWGMSAFSAGEDAKTLDERMSDLDSAISKFNSSLEAARTPMTDLTNQYGRFADEVQRALAAVAAADQRALAAEFMGAISGITEAFSGLFAGLETQGETSRFAMKKLEDQLRMNSQEVSNFKDAVRELETADTFAKQATAALKVMAAIDKARDAAGRLPPILQQTYDSLARLVPKAAEANAKISSMEALLRAARGAAKGAADAVDGIGAAARGAYKGVAALATKMWDLAHAQRAAAQDRQSNSKTYGEVGARGNPSTSNGSGVRNAGSPTIDEIIAEERKRLERDNESGGGKKDKPLNLTGVQDSETATLIEKYKREHTLLEDALKKGQITKERYRQLEAALGEEYFGNKVVTLQEQYDLELAALDAALKSKLISQEQYNSAVANLDKSLADQRRAAWSGAFGDLSALMNTNSKKLFKIGKIAAIAQATLDGWSSATAAYKKGTELGGPKVGTIFAAMSLAKTGAMLASIKSTSFDGGGGGGGASAGGSAAAAAPAPQAPLEVRLRGDGSSVGWNDLGTLLTKLNEEAGDRGYRLLTS